MKKKEYIKVMVERCTTHGGTNTDEYGIWKAMRQRCKMESHPSYKNYGARGISVSDEWEKDFGAFIKDVGYRPTTNHTLDRIDNNGNYCKENCRWVLRKKQANNRRDNVVLTFNGKTQTAMEWADELGIPVYRIYTRLAHGFEIGDVLSKNRLKSRTLPVGFKKIPLATFHKK